MKMMGLLKLLYGEKMVSKCCKENVRVEHGDSESMYYVCEACHRPCDTTDLKDL